MITRGLLILVLLSTGVTGDMTLDDDDTLTFIWEAASGNASQYAVFLSVDGGEYEELCLMTPVYFVIYDLPIIAEVGRSYSIKVQGVEADGMRGPVSVPSEPPVVRVIRKGPLKAPRSP